MGHSEEPTHTWLLGLLTVLVWWPLGSYWQSDDFLAVHYASEFGRALSDFAGGHYGVETLVVFYRPMITLSFALEGLFGPLPMLAHLSNVAAHAISAICLAHVARRFLPARQAWLCGLLWALSPGHAGSIYWTVGRVDSHTTMWIALCALLFVRSFSGPPRNLIGSLLCFVLALGSKELALVTPGIVAVLGFGLAAPGRRFGTMARRCWPFFLVLGIYFAWRKWFVFDSFLSGYETRIDPMNALAGLGEWTLAALNPLTHSGTGTCSDLGFTLPTWLPWLGFLPALPAISTAAAAQHRAFLLGVVCLYLGCSLPMVATWADTDNLMNLRGFYLPTMPLAALLAIGGWRVGLPTLLVFALPFLELRSDYRESWERCASLHASLLEKATAEHNFVAGLPRIHPRGTSIELHLGLDRLLRSPFAEGNRTIYALRPISQDPQANRIPYGPQTPLPFGRTLRTVGSVVEPATSTTNLKTFTADYIGPTELTREVLDRMVQNFQAKNAGRATVGTDPAIWIRGVRANRYRVTVFTASGYLTTMVKDSAPPGTDGKIDIGQILYGRLNGPGDEQRVGELLQHGTALDLSTRFPVLIEADTRPNPAKFEATHANRRPIFMSVFREFADWWP